MLLLFWSKNKSRDFISNLIISILSDKSIITPKKFTFCRTQNSKQIYFPNINQGKFEVPLVSFSFSAFGPWKMNFDFFC